MGLKGAKKSLAASRPPKFHQRPKSITRKATKTLINTHHQLEKKRHQALHRGDEKTAASIGAEIEALGGLERYQTASLQGQRKDRGGDSSRVLMEWLGQHSEPQPKLGRPNRPAGIQGAGGCRRILEVGALSIDNACSRSGCFDIQRIDLNSQGSGILQQDFMERPLPKDDSERFDIISLSLVLNFVPDPKARGDMLLRTLEFLRPPRAEIMTPPCVPCLFLVLPSPCVLNSRYLDGARLAMIMESLGYAIVHSKTTQRLVYYLWKWMVVTPPEGRKTFPKKEIRAGSSRNNFAIVI